MKYVLQDIPVDDRRYVATRNNVTRLGILHAGTEEEEEEEEEEMFMTPPETLPGYNFFVFWSYS